MTRRWSQLAWPVGLWLVSGFLFAAAARYENCSPQSANTWARWDSYQYLSIAADGYKIWHEPRVAQGRIVEWRGNTAWFPLYPILIRTLTKFGVDPALAARVIAEFFWLLVLVVLWNLYLRLQANGLWSLALAAVFPGAIYCHASFPISLTLFLILVYIHALAENRFAAACLSGLLAGTAYTSGLYLAISAFIWGCTEKSNPPKRRRFFWAATLSPLAGVGLVFLMQRAETGAWDSFFRVFEFHRYNGWSWIRLKQMIYIPTISHPTEFAKALVITQSVTVLTAVCGVLWERRPISFTRMERLVLITVLLFWILPHLSPYRLSWYRAESLLLPMVILMASLPRIWKLIFLGIWMPLAWLMALEFFRGVLV